MEIATDLHGLVMQLNMYAQYELRLAAKRIRAQLKADDDAGEKYQVAYFDVLCGHGNGKDAPADLQYDAEGQPVPQEEYLLAVERRLQPPSVDELDEMLRACPYWRMRLALIEVHTQHLQAARSVAR
jgi:hypothetical protein